MIRNRPETTYPTNQDSIFAKARDFLISHAFIFRQMSISRHIWKHLGEIVSRRVISLEARSHSISRITHYKWYKSGMFKILTANFAGEVPEKAFRLSRYSRMICGCDFLCVCAQLFARVLFEMLPEKMNFCVEKLKKCSL